MSGNPSIVSAIGKLSITSLLLDADKGMLMFLRSVLGYMSEKKTGMDRDWGGFVV